MANTGGSDYVLEIENVGISYFTRIGEIPAVPDFSLKLKRGKATASWVNRGAARPRSRWRS